MSVDRELSKEQARAAWFESRDRHLLVLARPGSGKTYTLAARARYLLANGVQPEQILAMTFSRRAALELKDRLPGGEIWAGTFHAICADILEMHGAAIGIRWPFRIVDEVRANEILVRAALDVGHPLFSEARAREKQLFELRHRIEKRKRLGIQGHSFEIGESLPADMVALIDDRYCECLGDSNALDYDDLLASAVTLIEQDENSAEILRNRLSFLLLDEFHDMSPVQYRLVTLLAPRRHRSQIMAVGDPDQSIYGWRGADVSLLLRGFRADYRPQELHLTTNYRSRSPIVAAADSLMKGSGRTRPSRPERPGSVKPHWCIADDPTSEANVIVALIQKAMASGAITNFGDFAVLYRTHAVGNDVEHALLQAEMPVWRVQRQRFFSDADAQESLRYLELALGLHGAEYEPSLNWPRVIVDEVTMAYLRQVARSLDLSLIEMLRRADSLGEKLSALTRGAIRDFLDTLGRDLEPLVGMPIGAAFGPFLSALKARRSPLSADERTLLRDTLDLIEPPLMASALFLFSALQARRPIAIQVSPGPDSAAAAVVVEHVLITYFNSTVVLQPQAENAAEYFSIALGEESAADRDRIGLGPVSTRTVHFSVATRSWRLMQMLLMMDEDRITKSLVLFDIETTSSDSQRAEILEYAVVPWAETRCTSAVNELVGFIRPSSPQAITRQATDIHGLRWSDVAKAPCAAEVLPNLLGALNGKIVVGHGVQEFDLVVLRRTAERMNLKMNPIASIDTRAMAQRLWPHEVSYRLEDLVRRLDPKAIQQHRALEDCRDNGRLFAELIKESLRDREIDALSECLSVVAASILVCETDSASDNALLVEIGKRSLAHQRGAQLLSIWEERIDSELATTVREHLSSNVTEDPEDQLRWDRLEQGWKSAVETFCTGESDQSIGRFLHYAALAQPIDVSTHVAANGAMEPSQLTHSERIALMTIHSAKGLEWRVVFLVGVEDDLMPGFRATSETAIEEERRVFYVGMTRAQDRLFLLSSNRRNGFSRRPSRFLDGLVPETVQQSLPEV